MKFLSQKHAKSDKITKRRHESEIKQSIESDTVVDRVALPLGCWFEFVGNFQIRIL